MHIMTMQAVFDHYLHTSQPFEFEDGSRHSTLICALRDARALTQRDTETGKFSSNLIGQIGSWPGAMMYMTILDQIGTAFYRSEMNKLGRRRSPILKAITYFDECNSLSEEQIHAIIGLRNAFFHNFNLIHVPDGNSKENKLQRHRFVVMASLENWTVKLPATPWLGDYEDKPWSNSTATFINLYQIGQLVEFMIICLIKLNENGILRTLEKNPKAFVNRYTFKTLNYEL